MDSRPRDDLDARIEAAVRRYMAKMGRRYAPVVAGLVAFALMIALVPTVEERRPSRVAGDQLARNGSGEAAGGESTDAAVSTDLGAGNGTVAAGPVSAGRRSSSKLPANVTAPPPAGSRGVTKSGLECGPGVRQVTWSRYAPICVPAFSGANGDVTNHGVTKDTITITYRKSNSTEDSAVDAAAGDASPGKDDDFIADMQTYVDFFNKQYELYGRKVVLKAYQGSGDYLQEVQGQGASQAQADAAKAYDEGAFLDATFLLKGSQLYWRGLYEKKVIAVGPLGFPQSYYEKYSPYWWSVAVDGGKGTKMVVTSVCRRLAGMPAIFAGEAGLQTTTRAFGLITPENPEYVEIGDDIEKGLKGCGQTIKSRARYTINVATFQAQAVNLMAQMDRDEVTTVLCYCDPLIPIFLSQAAEGQQYRPEWLEPNYRDPQGRLMDQDQWAHALSNGGTFPERTKTEAYVVHQLAKPGAKPVEQYYDVAYATVLWIFNALQAAGPNLNAFTFRDGVWSLPRSGLGEYGTWYPGRGHFSPNVDTQVGWWDPNATSKYDGKKGAWQSCEGGAWVPFDNPEAWGPVRTQPKCFGR